MRIMFIRAFAKLCLSIFISNVFAGENVSGACYKLDKKDFITHIKKAELKYGESEALIHEGINKMSSCLLQFEICVVGVSGLNNNKKIKIWSANTVDELTSDFEKTKDALIFSAIQFGGKANTKACVASSRLLVNATPWFVKAWKEENSIVTSSNNLSFYASYNSSMSPKKLVQSMKDSYEYWLNRN